MRSGVQVVLVVLLSIEVAAQPPFHGPPKGLPPGFEEVLPRDVVQRLKALHADSSLSHEQRHQRFDAIMSSLPPEILDRLPEPPFFKDLPPATREQLKKIHRDRSLSWGQRHEKIHAIIESLPPNLRPHPPHLPPGMFKNGGRPF